MELPGQRVPYSRSSSLAQKCHFWTIAAEIIVVLAIGGVAAGIALNPNSPLTGRAFLTVSLLFILSLVLRLVNSLAHFDTKWYSFRAVAESMKTVSWLYAMRAGAFSIQDEEAEVLLRERLLKIEEDSSARPFASTVDSTSSVATPAAMKSLRAGSWKSRRATYLRDRLENQRTWYHKKMRFNSRVAVGLTGVVIAIQAVGVALALVLLQTPGDARQGVPIIALFALLTSGVLAWTQAKQYSELVAPYSTALNELQRVKVDAESASSEEEFTRAVEQTEFTISREHVSWLARRGLTPREAH